MFTLILDRMIAKVNCCPWQALDGGSLTIYSQRAHRLPAPYLYSVEQRRRRDATAWTMVQGVLAPFQFAVFLISLGLVMRFLLTGHGESLAIGSVVVKTIVLYTIMITGCLWEHAVFGRYLFAKSFFWEDVFSLLVIGLHTLYVAALISGDASVRTLMMIALAAYAAYLINAGQFMMKMRTARREQRISPVIRAA
jgi:3-vinyl bacteriochlorophyllide hydratase